MNNLKSAIKKIGFVKKLRAIKWKRHARAELFTAAERSFLEKKPDKISKELPKHLERLPDGGKSKLAELNKVYHRSPLSKRPGLDEEALKEDILFWHFAYGFTFQEYASYQFDDKAPEERRLFLSDRDCACLCYDLNDLEARMVLADKTATYERFKPYFDREAITISEYADLEKFLSFLKRHERFVKKDAFESCGRSVELIDLEKVPTPPKELFETWISQGKTILEEVVVQSEKLALFNSSSVNTVRSITFCTKNGVTAPFFFMKSGRAGSFIDNGAAGGLLIGVDAETGILGTATDEYGNRFERHPDSGVLFHGFQLPDWNQLIDTCCEMSAMLPTVRIIGWDMAHTDHGWVAIEGNSMTEAIGPQSTLLRGMRETVEALRTQM